MSNRNRQGTSRREFLRMGAVGLTGAVLLRQGQFAFAQGTYTPPAKDASGSLTTYNWGNPDEAKVYADAFARFKQRYPNVAVTDNIAPVSSWADYADKLLAQVAGGKPPDIINIAIEGVQLAAAKGLLMPLNDYLKNDPDGAKLLADIPKVLLDSLSVDGKLYEIPKGYQTMVIHYNTKMFKDKGMDRPKDDWTWDDFLTTAKAFTSGSGSDKIYGFGLPFANFQLHPWWITNGTYPVTSDYKQSNLNDPKFIEAVTFVHDLVNVHKVSPDPIGLNVYDQFAAGKYAMVGAGRWPIIGWKQAGFTDFDIVPWPKKTTAGTVFGDSGWGISPASKNKDLAWEAIKDLMKIETITATMKIGQEIPALPQVAQDPFFLSIPPNAKLFFDEIKVARPVAAPVYFTDLERILMRHLEDVITGAASPADGMKAAHEELQAAIEKSK